LPARPSLAQAAMYLISALGWYLGGFISRKLSTIGKHIRPWDWYDFFRALVTIYCVTLFGYLMPLIKQTMDPATLAVELLGISGLAYHGAWAFILSTMGPLILITFLVKITNEVNKR
jgi:hypothetical protein